MNTLIESPIAIRHLQEEITRLEKRIDTCWYEDDNIDSKMRIEAMKERIKMFKWL